MPIVDAVVTCPVHDSFRVQQVAAMFDVPLAAKAVGRFRVEVPEASDDWTIGAIVGPSGSGKTTIARQAFDGNVYEPGQWSPAEAAIDGFGDWPTRQITRTLTAVGFSSPPAWVRPYHVLSNGERFRCDLARALLGATDTVVFDEFTSVVDRTVAKVGSAAVAKAIRAQRVGAKRFVAVSCHYDILPWLQPDWTIDMATCQLARGCLRRPKIRIEVVRCSRDAWRLFGRHHYLNATLHPSAQCYLATWEGEPVCFAAALPLMGKRGHWRISRLVTLPDYQGIGIGSGVLNEVAEIYTRRERKISCTVGHPGMIRHLSNSPLWRTTEVSRFGRKRQAGRRRSASGSRGRAVVSFAYQHASSLHWIRIRYGHNSP